MKKAKEIKKRELHISLDIAPYYDEKTINEFIKRLKLSTGHLLAGNYEGNIKAKQLILKGENDEIIKEINL